MPSREGLMCEILYCATEITRHYAECKMFLLFHCSETTVKMASLSPALSTMRDLEVPMPTMSTAELAGLSVGKGSFGVVPQVSGCPLTIVGFGEEVDLLKTRTRPKKIRLIASNGRSYTFLLKVVHIHDCPSMIWPIKAKLEVFRQSHACSPCRSAKTGQHIALSSWLLKLAVVRRLWNIKLSCSKVYGDWPQWEDRYRVRRICGWKRGCCR